MKAIFKYLCAGVLLVAYTVSMAGFGVHHCLCAHEHQSFGDACGDHRHISTERRHDSCCVHEEEATAETACCHAQRLAEPGSPNDIPCGCCTTIIRTLQTDQDITPSFSKIAGSFFMLCVLFQPVFAITDGFAKSAMSYSGNAPPLYCGTSAWLAFVSQWRL
ncbi:MAG: hypothetical protein LBD91_06575 [Prevotellaceae bacterium]|jgi:hypothetical protein|nr:hypothetical protein [Prevotellaceae bacterium]